MIRQQLTATAVLALAACGTSTGTEVDSPGIGTYGLVTIGAQSLPQTVVTGNGRRVRVHIGSLQVLRGESNQASDFLDYELLESVPILRVRNTQMVGVTSQQSGARVTIDLAGNADRNRLRPVTGWAAGDSLILEAAGEARWVYRRIQ